MTWTQELAEEWGNDYDDDIVRQKKLERRKKNYRGFGYRR